MEKLSEMTNGKKTYITCGITIGYALAGLYLGQMDTNQAMQMIFSALTMAFMRRAI